MIYYNYLTNMKLPKKIKKTVEIQKISPLDGKIEDIKEYLDSLFRDNIGYYHDLYIRIEQNPVPYEDYTELEFFLDGVRDENDTELKKRIELNKKQKEQEKRSKQDRKKRMVIDSLRDLPLEYLQQMSESWKGNMER